MLSLNARRNKCEHMLENTTRSHWIIDHVCLTYLETLITHTPLYHIYIRVTQNHVGAYINLHICWSFFYPIYFELIQLVYIGLRDKFTSTRDYTVIAVYEPPFDLVLAY